MYMLDLHASGPQLSASMSMAWPSDAAVNDHVADADAFPKAFCKQAHKSLPNNRCSCEMARSRYGANSCLQRRDQRDTHDGLRVRIIGHRGGVGGWLKAVDCVEVGADHDDAAGSEELVAPTCGE